MNTTLTASAVICAALVSGCSSAPTLPVPSGDWEDFHQTPLTSPPASPPVSAPKPVAVATTTTSASPAINAAVPVAQSKLPAAPVAPLSPSVLQPKLADPKVSTSAPIPAGLAKNSANAPSKPVVSVSSVPIPQKVIVSSPVPPMVIATVTTPPKPLPEPWVVSASDTTLRRALNKWVQRAGWQLVWDASVDVPINVDAKFTGDFNTAVKHLFQSLSAADVNLSAVLYSGNRVLRVTESGRRAQ